MPLIKRKPVTPLPHPEELFDGSLPPDTEVFLLKATGELFLDYASYSQRMQFYLQKVFVDEYSGKSGIDYFEALDTEFEESKKTSDKFPDALKPKVLRACQFQLEGRQDKLGEAAYERFNNRYFLGEKVVVHHGVWPHGPDGPQTFQQYFGLVISVIPPPQIRALNLEALERRKRKGNGQDVLRLPGAAKAIDEVFPNALFDATRDEAEVDAFAHVLGSRLDLDRLTAEAMDSPFEYTYIIRLMEGSQFHGTDMHVNCNALSRDRQTWNKNLIKRFIKESMTRENIVGAPWLVKRKLANLYKMPYEVPESMQRKGERMRDDVLNKRKKGGAGKRELDSPVLTQPRAKRVKSANDSIAVVKDTSHLPLTEQPAHEVIPLRKNTKYPIEDLDLDPRTILDGRILRSKHNELPALPSKPEPHRALPVPQEHFGAVLECWNFLSVFGGALALSPFSLDDFVHALLHNCLDPRCILLAEIYSVLSCNIASEFGLRTAGTVSANAEALPYIIAHDLDNDGMSIQDREDWVLKALEYSRGWDRKARPKPGDGRKGWELHLTGVLTQRGALSVMPTLPVILRHMFTAPVDVSAANGNSSPVSHEHDGVQPANAKTEEQTDEDGTAKPDVAADAVKAEPELQHSLTNGVTVARNTCNNESYIKNEQVDGQIKADEKATVPAEELQDWEETEHPEPEARFLTLDLKYKLDILKWLIELNLMSKVVRAYVDLCESRLTDERKEKADMNKERRELLAEKALLEPSKFSKNKPKKDDASSIAGGGDDVTAAPVVNEANAVNGVNGTSTPATGADSLKVGVSAASASAQPSANGDDGGLSSRIVSSSPLSDNAADEIDEMHANGTTNGDIDMDDSESRAVLTSMADAVEEDEVASDVDELESSSDEAPMPLPKKAQPKVKKEKEKEPVDRKTAIEGELKLIAQKEDAYDRDWRRHREVARAHPLGYDRFFHKYWWIDGIGDHDLVDSEGAITYGTGQLFVQGPSAIDHWEMCMRYSKGPEGEKKLAARRNHEESNNVRLDINEWAAYEDEEQINLLLLWLNDKGNRENALKKNILKWKEYIVEGTKARKNQLASQPEVTPPSRRTRGSRGRGAFDNSPAFHYLAYENLLGQQKAEDNRR